MTVSNVMDMMLSGLSVSYVVSAVTISVSTRVSVMTGGNFRVKVSTVPSVHGVNNRAMFQLISRKVSVSAEFRCGDMVSSESDESTHPGIFAYDKPVWSQREVTL